MANYWTTSLSNDVLLGVCEVADSTSETIDASKGLIAASAQLICPWANREQVIDEILGNWLPWPRYPLAGCFAQTATVIPYGGIQQDGTLAIPPMALLNITYGQGDEKEETAEGLIISESLEPSAEFLTLNYRDFRWGAADGDKLTAEEAPGKLLLGLDYIQTIYNLAALPSQLLTPNIVNNASVTASLLGLTFPAETLLYCCGTASRATTTTGTQRWVLVNRFSYRPNGWNKFWRPKNQAWEEIYIADGGVYKNFPPASFTGLVV